jgi:tetratricopeptide (TPR) repeat protein
MKIKEKLLISVAATGMLITTAGANTSVLKHNSINKSEYIQEKVNNAIKSEKKKIKNVNKIMSHDKDRKAVLLALQNFTQALFDLKAKDKVSAEAKLKYAKNVLKNVKKEIVPIQSRMFLLEFEGTPPAAKKLATNIKKMVNKGNLQGTSELLNLMKDEIDVYEIDVNKKGFEKTVDKIYKMIKANKLNEAFKAVAKAFNDPGVFPNFIVKYPLGLIKAAFLVENAKALESMKKIDYKKIDILIEEAIQELKLDKELGYFYGKEKLYGKALNELEKIKQEAEKNKTGSYKELNEVLKTLKINSQKVKNPRNFLIKKIASPLFF